MTSGYRLAVEHLKAHPELHTMTNQQLEKTVEEVKVSYQTWRKAKDRLHIAQQPRYCNTKRPSRLSMKYAWLYQKGSGL